MSRAVSLIAAANLAASLLAGRTEDHGIVLIDDTIEPPPPPDPFTGTVASPPRVPDYCYTVTATCSVELEKERVRLAALAQMPKGHRSHSFGQRRDFHRQQAAQRRKKTKNHR